ncbi:MAG: hypothetical protein J7J44_03830 [Deltaproteobacteria bacterium]|nr:hypothetical protein [Deltaproteobacteria bacterium]
MPSPKQITGETGAGKSIIINPVKLLSGERALRDMIRYGAEGDMSMQSFLSKIFSPNPVSHLDHFQ